MNKYVFTPIAVTFFVLGASLSAHAQTFAATDNCNATTAGEYTACLGVSSTGSSTFYAPSAAYFTTEGEEATIVVTNYGTNGPGVLATASSSIGVVGLGPAIGLYGLVGSSYTTDPIVAAGVMGSGSGSGYLDGVTGVIGIARYASSTPAVDVNGVADVAGVYGSGSGSGVSGVFGSTGGSSAPVVSGNPGVVGTSGAGYGVEGLSSNSTGVHGASSYGYGVSGTSTATSSYGVYGTGAGGGIKGEATGTGGVGVYATTNNYEGYGVYADNTATTGSAYGIYSQTSSSEGTAIHGQGGALGVVAIGTAYGGLFESAAIGIQGTGTATGSTAVYGLSAGGTGSYAGYFYGNVEITGTLNGMTPSSDARLKTNIEPLTGKAIDQLLKLRGVTYDWKDPQTYGEGTQTGFIAQEVEKVFPSWVTEDKAGMKRISTMRGFEALEVESIRVLKAENDKQKAQIEDLQEHMKAMENGTPIKAGSGFNFGSSNVGMFAIAGGLVFLGLRRKKDKTAA
jgi:hypothetical protein